MKNWKQWKIIQNSIYLFRTSTLIQKLVVLVWMVLVVIMWPLCLVRNEVNNSSGDHSHAFTEELAPGMSFTQYFQAEKGYLKTVDYVLYFNPELPLEGKFFFELLNEKGEVIFSQEYPYNMTPDYRYCNMNVEQRVRKGAIYTYRLTNVDVTQNIPTVVYTQDFDMHAKNNCGMLFNGQEIQGEALSRYVWEVPMPWWETMFYAGFIGLLVFVLWEVETLRVRRKNKGE